MRPRRLLLFAAPLYGAAFAAFVAFQLAPEPPILEAMPDQGHVLAMQDDAYKVGGLGGRPRPFTDSSEGRGGGAP